MARLPGGQSINLARFVTVHLKILVVDAALDGAERIATIADELGHEVTIAQDGIEAVEHYRTADSDLIFMAVTLPGLDGI